MTEQWAWVFFPGDKVPTHVYLREIDGITTWGWDEEDDPEVLPDGCVVLSRPAAPPVGDQFNQSGSGRRQIARTHKGA